MTDYVVYFLLSLALIGAFAIFAVGLVLIYQASRVLNLAHGAMATLPAYGVYTLDDHGVPVLIRLPIAAVVGAGVGIAVERVFVRILRRQGPTAQTVGTVAAFGIITAVAGKVWGTAALRAPTVFPEGGISISGSLLSWGQLGIFVVSLLFAAGVFALFKYTRLGLAMRAAAENPAESRLVAIPVGRMLMLGWGMAAVCGALAGVLVAPTLFLDPNMMGPVMIYSFAAAVLGGFDSPFGAILGGWIIGIAENLAGSYVDFIGQDLKILVPLAIILAILLARPQGLFGSPQVARV
jgi:branched-chain amino acid transport system permease protein